MNLRISAILLIVLSCVFKMRGDNLIDSVPTHYLQEVVVTDQSARNRIQNVQLGSETLELTRLASTPKMFGETDIIKSITLLPGISGEAEGVGSFQVRGGNAYQNLVTMDGMTLYNPAHIMGFFSTFNDDATASATIFKGPIPVCFGGASSSVLETFLQSGDMNKYHFSGTLGILNAKISANGPIVKDNLSFALAARRSYVDMFFKMIPQYRKTEMNFYDLNAKFRYSINANNTVDLSFFTARDNLAISNLMYSNWGNLAGSVNWYAQCGSNWRFTTTGAVTNYTTDMGSDIMDVNQALKEYIRSFAINENAVYTISDNHSLQFGLRSELLQVKSGDMIIRELRQKEIRSGWQNAIWVGYDGFTNRKISVSVGARASLFSAISNDAFHSFETLYEESPDFSAKSYFNIEPRGSAKYQINDNHSIKLGASLTTQNIHGIRATTTTFPFDRYALTSPCVKPELTSLYSLGYAGMTPEGLFDWSVEAYYKSMKNVYDYRDGVTMFSRINLESLILCGKGRSYGLEFIFRKNIGKLTGWVSYTLSKTETRIPDINNNKWYNASNDRRNDVAIVAIYDINDKWKLSGTWTYSSGRPLTAPDEKYEIDGTTCYYYTGRNTYKTPDSHRLDLSATYTVIGKRVTSIWSFGIYNAYSHHSPYIIYFEDDSTKPSGTKAVQLSLFGIVPSVSYTIKF